MPDEDLEFDPVEPDLREALDGLELAPEPLEDFATELRREELTDPYSGGPRPQPPFLFMMTAMGPAADARAHQRLEDLRLLAATPQPKNFIVHGQRLTTDVPAGLRALGLNILADAHEELASVSHQPAPPARPTGLPPVPRAPFPWRGRPDGQHGGA